MLRAQEKFELLAHNTMTARFLASPAASNGRLFPRSDDVLIAVGSGAGEVSSGE